MEARYLVALLLVCLAGCQSGGNTELMERELRLQEDRIYYLEDELARCCQAMQALQTQGTTAPVAPTPSRPGAAGNMGAPADAIPKVELELPTDSGAPPALPVPGPASLNELPKLFEPAPHSDAELGTAMRIVRPVAGPPVVKDTDAAPARSSSPAATPRMRFASAVDAPSVAARDARTVVEWSAASTEREAEPSPQPREPVTVGATPRRPQWSPYR